MNLQECWYRTNHSLRLTSATSYQSAVDGQLVMDRTGHCSLNRVRSYKRTSDSQCEALSDILNRQGTLNTGMEQSTRTDAVCPTQSPSAGSQSPLCHLLTLHIDVQHRRHQWWGRQSEATKKEAHSHPGLLGLETSKTPTIITVSTQSQILTTCCKKNTHAQISGRVDCDREGISVATLIFHTHLYLRDLNSTLYAIF